MDICAVYEGLAHIFVARKMGKNYQFNLRIVCRNEDFSFRRGKGRADTAACFVSDRNILKIRVAAGKTAGGRSGLYEICVNAALVVYQLWQGFYVS